MEEGWGVGERAEGATKVPRFTNLNLRMFVIRNRKNWHLTLQQLCIFLTSAIVAMALLCRLFEKDRSRLTIQGLL